MGFRAGVNVGKRGFFPKGGGVVSFSSRRARLPLKPVNKTDLAPLDFIEIFSSSASLPTSVSRDQVAGARHALRHLNAPFEEFVESAEQSSSIGSSVSVFAHFGSSVLSGSALGARGKPAEKVGKEAAQALLGEIQPKAPCGSHLADQLLPFMALAKGKSEIFCSRITPHCLANIAVIERFLPVKFIADSPLESPGRISVDGAAFVP
jgi:RNA 3'-terminal phosphate cyclase